MNRYYIFDLMGQCFTFSALTLCLGGRKRIRPVKNGGWWRWALVSPDGVARCRMVGVSASVNLPLHHNVQKFSSGTGSPGWSWKKRRKTDVMWWCGGTMLVYCHWTVGIKGAKPLPSGEG